jgi:hypothetical protein
VGTAADKTLEGAAGQGNTDEVFGLPDGGAEGADSGGNVGTRGTATEAGTDSSGSADVVATSPRRPSRAARTRTKSRGSSARRRPKRRIHSCAPRFGTNTTSTEKY